MMKPRATYGLRRRRFAGLHRTTAYDACYIALALRLGLPLATSDKLLVTAAGIAGGGLDRRSLLLRLERF